MSAIRHVSLIERNHVSFCLKIWIDVPDTQFICTLRYRLITSTWVLVVTNAVLGISETHRPKIISLPDINVELQFFIFNTYAFFAIRISCQVTS